MIEGCNKKVYLLHSWMCCMVWIRSHFQHSWLLRWQEQDHCKDEFESLIHFHRTCCMSSRMTMGPNFHLLQIRLIHKFDTINAFIKWLDLNIEIYLTKCCSIRSKSQTEIPIWGNNIIVVLGEPLYTASWPLLDSDIVVHYAMIISAADAISISEDCLGTGVWVNKIMVHAQVVAKLVTDNLENTNFIIMKVPQPS